MGALETAAAVRAGTTTAASLVDTALAAIDAAGAGDPRVQPRPRRPGPRRRGGDRCPGGDGGGPRSARRRDRGVEGQHVHAGDPDDVLVAHPGGLEAAVRRHRGRAVAGGGRDRRSARPTSTSSPWARPRRTRRSGRRATRSTPPVCPEGRAVAAPPPSPPGSAPCRSAATPAGRSANRRRCAAWSGSSRRTATSAATDSLHSQAVSTRSARSPPRSPTPHWCST